HCKASHVTVGQRVAVGQRVGTVGGMNAPHVHVETSVQRNGSYWLIDPVPALKAKLTRAPRAGLKAWSLPGSPAPVYLPEGITVVQKLLPASQTRQRPGKAMRPEYYTQHETGNPR